MLKMDGCRNAIEEPVIEEAKAQIKKLGQQYKADLSEVAAFALNRLPPMYATTQRGWMQQRKRARDEFAVQITAAVRQAMMGVRRDPLREPDPLPESELESQARSLSRLQRILNKEDLKWKDVPAAVNEAIANIRIRGSSSSSHVSFTRRNVQDIKGYLKRTKSLDGSMASKQATLGLSEQSMRASMEAKEFESYMTGAACGYRNTLENLVLSVAQRQVQRLHPEVAQNIKLEDVMAYALNRLPPMYATSNRGLHQQRQRAKADLANEIMSTVRQAILTVGKVPVRLLPPLPFERFSLEQDAALSELGQILHRDDVTWRNVADIVEDLLEQTQGGDNRPMGYSRI
jgi:hypothetical protein